MKHTKHTQKNMKIEAAGGGGEKERGKKKKNFF